MFSTLINTIVRLQMIRFTVDHRIMRCCPLFRFLEMLSGRWKSSNEILSIALRRPEQGRNEKYKIIVIVKWFSLWNVYYRCVGLSWDKFCWIERFISCSHGYQAIDDIFMDSLLFFWKNDHKTGREEVKETFIECLKAVDAEVRTRRFDNLEFPWSSSVTNA